MSTGSLLRTAILVTYLAALVIIFFRADLVQPVNAAEDGIPPEADAGEDILIDQVVAAHFDGSGSFDEVSIEGYVWTFEYENDTVILEGVDAYFLFQVHGTYEVTLNVTNNMGVSDTDTLTVTVLTPPGPITGLLAIPRSDWVELAWSPPVHDGGLNISGCIVYRGTTPDTMEPYFSDWWIRYWSWDYLAENGQTYYYAVAAINEVGMGPLSHVVNATPFAMPDSPQNLEVEVVDGEVHLSWEAPDWSIGRVNVTGYQVHRGTDPDWLYDTFDVGTNTTFVDTDVEPGVTYYYAVGAISDFGSSDITDVKPVTLEGDGQDWVTGVIAMTVVIGCLLLLAVLLVHGGRVAKTGEGEH